MVNIQESFNSVISISPDSLVFPALTPLLPFSGFLNYLTFALIAVLFIIFYTSLLYFSLHRVFREPVQEEEEGSLQGYREQQETEPAPMAIQVMISFFGGLAAVGFYLVFMNIFHSVKFDARGVFTPLADLPMPLSVVIADTLLATGIAVMTLAWFQFMLVMLEHDVFNRFRKMIRLIPWFSAGLILTFTIAIWYFYSGVFPLWWHMLAFGVSFGLIYFFSLKDFKRRIRMHLTQSMEYEENFSLATISMGVSVVILVLVVLPHVIYRTLPFTYLLALFLCLWIVFMYMTPDKVFRQVRVFPRFATMAARFLNLARYTRKYILVWATIFFILGLILGMGIFLDSGFTMPAKNFATCCENQRLVAETLDQYMDENKGMLPSSKSFASNEWFKKVSLSRKISSVPPCPARGKYIYKKWRDAHGRAVYEIRCIHGAHVRSGVKGDYPRYVRYEGLIKEEGKPGDLKTAQKSPQW